MLSSDSLRAVRGFLLDDRWIVLAAGVASAFARALQAERLETIECFAYWQWDLISSAQEAAWEVGQGILDEYDREEQVDYTETLLELGYYSD